MSSIELPQLMDDNLITRRKKIMQAIEDIRGKKSEIASALRELGIGKPEGNEEVKENMKQLLAAYDAISAQETQYMDILKTIVGIHEQATLDIAKDFEEKIKKDAEKLKEKKEKKEAEEEAVEEDNSEKSPEELANSEVMAELQEALLELKKVSEEAVAASELNEKLVERLQLTKKKKSAMMEVRAKKAKELDEEAARARAEVMERINKMAALKKTTGRQEKELKELQKQCLELGLTLGVDGEKEADSSATENQPKPELNEEEKEKRREEGRTIKTEINLKELLQSESWSQLLEEEFKKGYISEIEKFLNEEVKKGKQVFPPQSQIFTTFNVLPFEEISVVVIGQDPYHGDNQAHGLSFSVQKGVKPPQSLKNIFKELESDIDGFKRPNHGNLLGWTRQGVFMLNATLTVRAHEANSHSKIGWQTFTDTVIRMISEKSEKPIVFLLWGKFAQKKEEQIDTEKHVVIKTAHPSPFSARIWRGCKCFSKCNTELENSGRNPINWSDL